MTPAKHGNLSNQRGAVLVEAMVAYLVVLLLLIASIEMLRIVHVLARGQFLVNKGARSAMIGSVAPDVTREQSIKNVLTAGASALGMKLTEEDIFICIPAEAFSCAADNAGGPGDIVHIGIAVPVRFWSQPTPFKLRFGAAVKNEPV